MLLILRIPVGSQWRLFVVAVMVSLSACHSAWRKAAPYQTVARTIQRDVSGDRQWFHFRVAGLAPDTPLRIQIAPLAETAAPLAWSVARPFIRLSEDTQWIRAAGSELRFDTLILTVDRPTESLEVAYAPPYPLGRWNALVDFAASTSAAAVRLERGSVPLLRFNGSNYATGIWVIARQHPAETPGSWLLEGFVHALTREYRSQREDLPVVTIAGIVNPDGVELNTYRSDARGVNIAHEWLVARTTGVPEVIAAVQNEVLHQLRGGVHTVLVIDLHAHSSERRNYAYYGIWPGAGPSSRPLSLDVVELLGRFSADFDAAGSMGTSFSDHMAGGWFRANTGADALVVEATYHDLGDIGRPGDFMTVRRYRALGGALADAVLVAVLRG